MPEGRAEELQREGGDDARENRDAPHTRDGLLVHAAAGGLVDGAEVDGDAAREGRRREGDDEADGEEPREGDPIGDEVLHGAPLCKSMRSQ